MVRTRVNRIAVWSFLSFFGQRALLSVVGGRAAAGGANAAGTAPSCFIMWSSINKEPLL